MLISVVLPTYNVKEYITQCVHSLVHQTYRELEILIVDDGSTDGTGALCDTLALEDSRIRVFHKENGGTHTARNMGIREAKGEYIMFLDPDDWLDENTFQELVSRIRQDDLDVIRFGYVREFPTHSAGKENTFLPETLCQGEECRRICRQTLGLVGRELAHPENMNFLASACFSLYRKSIIDENGLELYNIREIATFSDGLFNIRFLQKANRFLYVDIPFYHYRKFAAGAATSNYRENFLQRQLILFGMLRKISEEENGEFTEAYNNRVIFSTMEICLNALKSDKGFRQKYGEVKAVLKSPVHRAAYKNIRLRPMPMKWKVYYFLVKTRLSLPVYWMTKAIRFIQRKG